MTDFADAPTSGKLAGVQAARGGAALMVVVYHTTRGLSLPQYSGYIPFGNAFGFGHAGVDFFFVLSGFIITYAHFSDIGKPERACRYLWRRVTRIYPIYWVVTLIEACRALFAADASVRLAPPHIVQSVLLLPGTAEPLVGVGWTLQYEMAFYLMFALVIVDRRCVKPLVTIAVLLIVSGSFVVSRNPLMTLLLSAFNMEFLLGIAAAAFVMHRSVHRPAVVLTTGIVCFLTVGVMEVLGFVPLIGVEGRLLYGSASVAILLGLTELERGGTLCLGRNAVLIGDTSYCLYLVHLAVIPLAIRACASIGLLALVPVGLIVPAMVALAAGAALALHLGVELPIMIFLRRHTPRSCR